MIVSAEKVKILCPNCLKWVTASDFRCVYYGYDGSNPVRGWECISEVDLENARIRTRNGSGLVSDNLAIYTSAVAHKTAQDKVEELGNGKNSMLMLEDLEVCPMLAGKRLFFQGRELRAISELTELASEFEILKDMFGSEPDRVKVKLGRTMRVLGMPEEIREEEKTEQRQEKRKKLGAQGILSALKKVFRKEKLGFGGIKP